jgi:hypothetical protein
MKTLLAIYIYYSNGKIISLNLVVFLLEFMLTKLPKSVIKCLRIALIKDSVMLGICFNAQRFTIFY